MLELLKASEPEVPAKDTLVADTATVDTVAKVDTSAVSDSGKAVVDTASQLPADTNIAVSDTAGSVSIKSTELAITSSSKNKPHLFYDEKRQKVFIRVEKNGHQWLIDVTGSR